jgi:DNA-binding transcriptional ArsR family regulator
MEERARKSPIRVRILELHEQDKRRLLDPDHLRPHLCRWFGDVSRSQIAYHLRWLRDSELIPSADPKG